jgi:hypothetical protein
VGNLVDGAFLIRTDRRTSFECVCGGVEVLLWAEIVTVPIASSVVFPQLDRSNAIIDRRGPL